MKDNIILFEDKKIDYGDEFYRSSDSILKEHSIIVKNPNLFEDTIRDKLDMALYNLLENTKREIAKDIFGE